MRARVDRWQEGQRVACPRCGSERYRVPSRARQVWELFMGAIVGLPLLALVLGALYLLAIAFMPWLSVIVTIPVAYFREHPWMIAVVIVISLALWLTRDAPAERICLDCGRTWSARR